MCNPGRRAGVGRGDRVLVGRGIRAGEGSEMQKRRFGLSAVFPQEDNWFWAKRVGCLW